MAPGVIAEDWRSARATGIAQSWLCNNLAGKVTRAPDTFPRNYTIAAPINCPSVAWSGAETRPGSGHRRLDRRNGVAARPEPGGREEQEEPEKYGEDRLRQNQSQGGAGDRRRSTGGSDPCRRP